MFGDERFKRYGCSEPGMFSDLVCREACQCDSKQNTISEKGMVVQQDFEKGRSHRLWFRRYDRKIFSESDVGGGGGAGGLVRAVQQ